MSDTERGLTSTDTTPTKTEIKVDPTATNSTEGNYPKNEDGGRKVYFLKPGFAYNPWLEWPRNLACVCGSGQKFKKCHADRLSRAIPQDQLTKAKSEFLNALRVVEGMKARGITYTTPVKEAQDEPTHQHQKPNDVPTLSGDLVAP